MKKISVILLFALTLFVLTGCSDDSNSIPIEFKCTLNGASTTFANDISVADDDSEIKIIGNSGDNTQLQLILHEVATGSFDESDIITDANTTDIGYMMYYFDMDDNVYTYSPTDSNSNFQINIDKFESGSPSNHGQITGTFSGYLYKFIEKTTSSPDTVIIESGEFSVSVDDRLGS